MGRHDAGHTRALDDTVAWLVTQASKTATVELLRVAWRTVGAIVARVLGDIDADVDRLAGLRRIGIDEISCKPGHRYLTMVVDHDSGRLVWAAAGRDEAALDRLFQQLGSQRCARIRQVSAEAADWIARRRIVRHPPVIDVALETDLSQGLFESTNTKIRLLARMAFGFKEAKALIALAMLALGGHRPDLPDRS